MHYKYNIGDIVVLRERLYLGDAKVTGYRNSMYVLEFALDHPELKTIRYPFVGGREFRGLYAAEHQIEKMAEHDPERQIWDDPIAASACEGALPWVEKRFLRKE